MVENQTTAMRKYCNIYEMSIIKELGPGLNKIFCLFGILTLVEIILF